MARKCCFAVLATVVALLTCLGPVTEVTASGLATSFAAGAIGEDHDGAQTLRRLRSNVRTTMEEEYNSSEERGLDKIPGVAKLMEMLTPDKQEAANKLFTKLRLHETKVNLFASPNFQKWVNSVTKSHKKTPDAVNGVIVSTITARHGDDGLARMVAAAKQAPTIDTRRFATQLEEVQLANWLTSKKTAGDVFKLLKLDDEGVKLFENPVFSTWVSYASSYATKLDAKNPDALMFSVLTARYGDDGLARMLVAAREAPTTQRFATQLEEVQLASWMTSKKTADDVFTLLKLDDEGVNLFRNPVFSTWVSYATKLDDKNPDALMFSVLKVRYGDDGLARMLVAAKEASTTRHFATQLEEAQLANWLASKQTVGGVFKLLKLDDEGVNLFRNPLFSTWVSYATKLDDKNPDALMFSVLKTRYNDDVLANIFTVAKETSSTQKIAARQEQLLFAKWTSDGITADDAFKLLKLNPKTDDFLKSPALDSWVSYVKTLGEDPYKLILAKLTARYTDDGLASMLMVAKQDHITASVATKLEDALFNRWQVQGKSAESVFKLLNLNKAEDKIFESPMLPTWTSYVRKLDENNPDEAMFSVLKTRYGDEVLTDMLIASRKSRTARYRVSGLNEVLFKNWVSEGKTADDIFKLLRLDKDGGKLFESPTFDMWISYVTKLDKKNPDKLMLSVLKTRYSDDMLQNMIIAAQKVPQTKTFAVRMQEEVWISQGKTADDIFKLLKLDQENLFDSRELSTWVSYVTKLNKLDETSGEFAVISDLQKRFGKMELARMISAALIDSGANKNLISSLQTLQFKRWLAEGVTPNSLSAKLNPRRLDLPGEAPILLSTFDYRSTGVAVNYRDFYRANKPRGVSAS